MNGVNYYHLCQWWQLWTIHNNCYRNVLVALRTRWQWQRSTAFYLDTVGHHLLSWRKADSRFLLCPSGIPRGSCNRPTTTIWGLKSRKFPLVIFSRGGHEYLIPLKCHELVQDEKIIAYFIGSPWTLWKPQNKSNSRAIEISHGIFMWFTLHGPFTANFQSIFVAFLMVFS